MVSFGPGRECLSLGAYQGARSVLLTGRNAAVGSDYETVWVASSAYVAPVGAVAMELVSGSANDTAGGTGVRAVEADMIDHDGRPVTLELVPNGTNPVPIPGSFRACNGLRAIAVGSLGLAAGNIDVRTVVGSNPQSRIPSGNTPWLNCSADFLYYVPEGFVGLLGSIAFSASAACDAILVVRGSNGIVRAIAGCTSASGEAKIELGGGLRIEGGNQIELRAKAASSASVFASAELILFESGVSLWV